MKIEFRKHPQIKKPRFEGEVYVIMCRFDNGKWSFADSFNNIPCIASYIWEARKLRKEMLIYIKPKSEYWNEKNILIAKIIL